MASVLWVVIRGVLWALAVPSPDSIPVPRLVLLVASYGQKNWRNYVAF